VAVTVQVPRACQSLFAPPLPAAYMKIHFDPANAALEVTRRFKVNVLPPAVEDSEHRRALADKASSVGPDAPIPA
jgi:hypothetical protein